MASTFKVGVQPINKHGGGGGGGADEGEKQAQHAVVLMTSSWTAEDSCRVGLKQSMSRVRTCFIVAEEGDKIEICNRCSASIWGVLTPNCNRILTHPSFSLRQASINCRLGYFFFILKVNSSVICIAHEKRVIVIWLAIKNRYRSSLT